MERKNGFVLLEVLPALLLLGAVLVTGLHLQRMALGLRTEGERLLGESDAFQAVWETWERTGGEAAVVLRGGDGAWVVMDFPDDGWLPEGSPNRWRRSAVTDGAGNLCWHVEATDARSGKWTWWASVYSIPEELP